MHQTVRRYRRLISGPARATRAILVTLAALCIAAMPAGPLLAQTSPTLTGEQFIISPSGGGGVQMSCSIDPTTSIATFRYIASGSALGPYPGTFGEEGTVTVDTTTGQLLSLTVEEFFIVGQEIVTGEKKSVPGFTLGSGECLQPANLPSFFTADNLHYTAELPDCTTDQGLSRLSITAAPPPSSTASMSESFTSVEQLIPALPSILPPGVGPGKSLQAKIDSVLAAFERGNPRATCGKLGALLNEVEAQSKKLTPAQADALTTAVKAAMVGLGC